MSAFVIRMPLKDSKRFKLLSAGEAADPNPITFLYVAMLRSQFAAAEQESSEVPSQALSRRTPKGRQCR